MHPNDSFAMLIRLFYINPSLIKYLKYILSHIVNDGQLKNLNERLKSGMLRKGRYACGELQTPVEVNKSESAGSVVAPILPTWQAAT